MDDPNQWWTLYWNVVISITAAMGLVYFMWRGLRIEHYYRPPVTAIAMICGGIFLRISPWAYGQLTAVTCGVADSDVGCLYNLDIIAARPLFTGIAAILILWGALKFRRWIDNHSIKNKIFWAGGICAAAFILTGF